MWSCIDLEMKYSSEDGSSAHSAPDSIHNSWQETRNELEQVPLIILLLVVLVLIYISLYLWTIK